jgi:hypothetical protein
VDDDVFFVPDHARAVVMIGHHAVIHAECQDEERIQQLIAHMDKAGFELPTEPPDATFIWPDWMPPPEDVQDPPDSP